MLQGVVPQAVIVFGHGIAFGATGVMAIFNQADRDACGFRAHLSIITVHAVEQMPFIVIVSIRGHKRAAITEGVERPDTAAVGRTETLHPGQNTRLQGYPLWDSAKMLRPEIDTLFIGDRRDGQFKFGLVSGCEVVLRLCCHGMSPSIKTPAAMAGVWGYKGCSGR